MREEGLRDSRAETLQPPISRAERAMSWVFFGVFTLFCLNMAAAFMGISWSPVHTVVLVLLLVGLTVERVRVAWRWWHGRR